MILCSSREWVLFIGSIQRPIHATCLYKYMCVILYIKMGKLASVCLHLEYPLAFKCILPRNKESTG